MFNIHLFVFEKRVNSTKRPDMADAATFSGEIKEDFSPVAPQVTFSFPDPTKMPRYNYAFINEFSRYYHITDWLFIGGLWRATMVCDALATYKEQILLTNQFVTRAANRKNPSIMDASYATTTEVIREEKKIDMFNLWGISTTDDGTIVAGVVNSSGQNIGAVTYYALPYGTFRNLMYRMLSDIAWIGIPVAELSEELQKALINPTQYIVSCVWLPINYDFFSETPQSSLKLGWWEFALSGTCKILSHPLQDIDTIQFDIQLPKHPFAADRGTWLNLSPYSRYTFTWLPFGSFELDSTELANVSKITITIHYHFYNGDATLYIGRDANQPFLTVNSNIGVQIPVGQIATRLDNFDQALKAAAAVGASEISSIWSQGGASAVVEAAKDTFMSSSVEKTPKTRLPGNGGR